MNKKNLSKEILKSINLFIKNFISDPNVCGILLTGSYAYGDPSKNSDLDVHIVYKKLDWRERSNTWINGFEI